MTPLNDHNKATNPKAFQSENIESQEMINNHSNLTEKPYSNFSYRQKAILVALAAWSASFSGLSSNIYFPALPAISTDLETSIEVINLSVTLYLLFQGLSPSFWAPISDRQGRRIVLLTTFLVYICACIGLACTKNVTQLLVLRALQSSGSASTVAIGAGIIGDIASRQQRGGYMGIFTAGQVFTTAIGPIIGGLMAQYLGWRSIFWLLTGYSGAFIILVALFLPETLRSIVGSGQFAPSKRYLHCLIQTWWTPSMKDEKNKEAFLNELPSKPPFKLIELLQPFRLLFDLKTFLGVFYLSIHYGSWQLSITAMSSLFRETYNLSEIQIGLTYIANGVGCMIGSLFLGKLLDRQYSSIKQISESKGIKVDIVKARLGSSWIFSLIQCISTLILGWTIDKGLYLAIPIIMSFFTSASTTAIQTAVNTFLVDSNPDKSASVTATLNLGRCLMAAGATALVSPMINGVGTGWAFTIVTLIMLFSNFLIFIQLLLARLARQIS